MKSHHFLIVGLCVASVNTAACSKQPDENTAAPAASESVLTDDALDQASIPVPEDFEEQANREITDENLDEQVSALEKEIEADK
jgi:hypothetical protein